MTMYHDIEKVLFQDDTMILTVDGKEYSLALKDISQRLAKASSAEQPTKYRHRGMASIGRS